MNNKGLYLYCLANGFSQDGMGDGIEGGEVFAIESGDLVAVVQGCEGSFSSEGAETVSNWVLTHQKVVQLAWEKYGTVIPCCFDTIILPKDGKTARENLVAWLRQEQSSLMEKLKKLEGKAEYGVQISWDSTTVATRIARNDRQIEEMKQEIETKGGGTAYLLRQKMEGVLRRRLEMTADAYFKEFYKKIEAAALEIRVEKVRKEDPPRQMLTNLSCLIHQEKVSEIGNQLDAIAKIDGFFVRFTGPWPPYSFV